MNVVFVQLACTDCGVDLMSPSLVRTMLLKFLFLLTESLSRVVRCVLIVSFKMVRVQLLSLQCKYLMFVL